MPYHRRIPSVAAAVTLIAFAAACNDDTSGPGEPALTQAQADSVAEVVVMDMDAEVDGAATAGGTTFLMSASGSAAICTPTVTPSPVVNTDGDRAPDSVRIEFPPCANTWGNHVDSISGSIDLVDPTPTVAGKNIRIVFNDLRHKKMFGSGAFTSLTLDGTREASRDSSVLQHIVTDFSTQYVFRNGGTASHTRTWSSTFTADVAGSIQRDAHLPSGTWDIEGSSTWTRGAGTHELEVTTDPDLHYNATCNVKPRFDSGTATAVVTRGDSTSTVTIEFTACGTYTVTRS